MKEKMIFFPLILSLMTGCLVFEVKGCQDRWLEFTCKYPDLSKNYMITVDNHRATLSNEWQEIGSYFLYNDNINKEVKVVIRKLENNKKYECEFQAKTSSEEEEENKVHVDVVPAPGQNPLHHTAYAYTAARTTITCDYPRDQHNHGIKFFCKDNDRICEEILSTKSSPKTNGTFTLTETKSGFTISIVNVSSHHNGVYWCARNGEGYRTGIQKIEIQIKDIPTITRSVTVGQNLTHICNYERGTSMKILCKGEDPSRCKDPITSTANRVNMTVGRFSMKEEKCKINATVTIREVTLNDSGTYWCGAKDVDRKFFQRLFLIVVPQTFPTTTSADSHGDSLLTVITVPVVCGAALLLVLILLLVYKRLKNKEQKNKEENAYEEIQEHPPKPAAGTAMNTIYVTASFPISPSDASHHSEDIFKNSRESECYSAATDLHQNDSRVSHTPGFSENLLYFTGSKD